MSKKNRNSHLDNYATNIAAINERNAYRKAAFPHETNWRFTQATVDAQQVFIEQHGLKTTRYISEEPIEDADILIGFEHDVDRWNCWFFRDDELAFQFQKIMDGVR